MSDKIEFQSVPVPVQHVGAVYRLLADLDREGQNDDGADEVTSGEPADAPWTDEMLTRLNARNKKATAILGKIMDVLAEHPGEWFALQDLEKPTGETQHQMRYIWSSLTRHFKNEYGTKKWPVDDLWGLHFDPRREPVMYYRVSDERAAQWKRITGA